MQPSPFNKFIGRLGNALKAFSGIPTMLPFSLSGFSANGILRRKSVQADPTGNYAGWVYAAISKRAKRIGAIDLHLYELNRNMDVEEVWDHDILALLNRANPMQSRYQFFYTIEMMLGIFGSAPVLKDRAGGKKVVYLWPLRPDLLKAETNNEGKVVRYEYRVGAKVDTFPAEDVIVINEPSPNSIATGFSPMAAASLEIDTDMKSALWNQYLLDNFAEPGGVLTTEQAIDDKSFARLKKEWEQRHQGASNAGRWALLEKGLKAESIGRSPQDMQLNDSRKANRNTIVAILGVPMALLTSEDVNLANAEAAERIFATDTVDPQMKLIVGMFNEFLVPEFGDNLELDHTSPIPSDRKILIEQATAGEGKWLTVNEARDMFDLPPLEGGDAIYKPLGVYPQVGDAKGTNDPMKGLSFEKITAKSHYKNDKVKARIKASILARTHMKRKLISGVSEKVIEKIHAKIDESASGEVKVAGIRVVDEHKHGPDCGHKNIKVVDDESEIDPRLLAERKEFVKRLPRQQKKFASQLAMYFQQQEKQVLKNLSEEGLPKGRGKRAVSVKSVDKWVNRIIFDQKEQDDLIVAMSGEMYRDNITTGAEAIARLLGIDPTDVLATPFVVDFIQDRSFLMLSVNKTTQDALRETLTEAVAEGESLGEIRDRISEVYDHAQDFRAETIARTEVGAAQNFGRNAEMENQGVKKKVWIAIFSNTRDAHAEADGQIVDVDESFQVGGESLEYPGDPSGSPENTINCQCSVSPTLG